MPQPVAIVSTGFTNRAAGSTMAPVRLKRVLQVVASMDVGGIETWLMQVLRRLDPRRLQMDFLVHSSKPCDYDAEILARGVRLLRCTASRSTPSYPYRVGRLLREFGPYDAVHSHVHHFSAYVLWLARRAGVPCRIAHSHTDSSRYDTRAGLARHLYLKITEQRIQRDATRLVAASQAAGQSLFGDGWFLDPRARILHCGVDLAPFQDRSGRERVRSMLGLSEQEFVIVHVGRFDRAKNHWFLTEIAAEVMRRRPMTRLLLLGDGGTRRAIEERVKNLGIAEKTIFAGTRTDVAQFLEAADAMVFPSLWEGLGLALVEAQAAGLPCVISDVIPEEAGIVPSLIHRVSLAESAAYWAERLLAAARDSAPLETGALVSVEDSSFNVLRSVEELYALYSA